MQKIKKILSILGFSLIILLPIVALYKFQAIEDWVKLYHYNPPTSITTIAAQDTMTPGAVHDFYVNHPKFIQDINTFNQECFQAEQAIVLGCYHPGQSGIFIHEVTDQRLSGIQQVTAAHEMLHAAYERLSAKDRRYVDQLLSDYYKNDLTDQRIKAEINSYKKSEPNQLVDEMHSVFGTEASDLPPSLENYYKKYFSERSVVVNYANNYQAEFTTRITEIDADDAKLNDLRTKINTEEASLKSQLSQINTDRAKLEGERTGGQIGTYNADVPGFNNEVDTYNSGVTQLQDDITYFNQLVAERNSLANELRSLDSAIDTRLSTQTSQ